MKKILFLFLLFFSLPYHISAQLNNNPDTFDSENSTLSVHPILHGSVVFTLGETIVFADPYGGAERYTSFNSPNIIVITHQHGDHFNKETLAGLDLENTVFVVPQIVAEGMDEEMKSKAIVLSNGETTEVAGISISAIPMYNLPNDESARHKKGVGNGYVINFDGMRVYISGDTEGIPEMRALENIDIAFVCMNLPFTMDIDQASNAVSEFSPKIMYPYHHRGQDIEEFKKLVASQNADIDVRLKNWYPN